MADNKDKLSKEEAKAAKEAAKAAEKERKERIKRNKPKNEDRPNIFVRMGRAIKRFFKDFRGTCKKVIWPDGKTVIKSSGVVIVCVLIVGIGIWIVDWGLSAAVQASTEALAEIGDSADDDAEAVDEEGTTDAAEAEETTASSESGATEADAE